MLVLGRKHGEALVVTLPDGREGRITVRGTSYKTGVRLACEFPTDAIIRRAELEDRPKPRPKTTGMKPQKPLINQIVDLRALCSALLRIIRDIEPEVTSPSGMARIAEAKKLLG